MSMTLTDHLLKEKELLIALVEAEHGRQLEKWGIQEHTPFEWMTFLTEEVGELAQAITEHNYRGAAAGEVVKEAIQAATLALKIAEMYLVKTRIESLINMPEPKIKTGKIKPKLKPGNGPSMTWVERLFSADIRRQYKRHKESGGKFNRSGHAIGYNVRIDDAKNSD